MSVQTYSKAGTKSTTTVKLDKDIFAVQVKSHELLNQAYVAYLANGRQNLAQTKKRGEVRGGGKKPWKQKGTGRARFGSSRVPIWRGGGITFGPTGNENYSHKMHTSAKQLAIRQALSLSVDSGKMSVIETFECKDGKVKTTLSLFEKIGAKGSVLLVVSQKDDLVNRATSNIPKLKVVQANYLNVYDVLNADAIVVSKKSINILNGWLGKKKAVASKETVK